MEFLRSMNHVAAWLGSSLLLLSEMAWIDLSFLSWKLKCIRGSPNFFLRLPMRCQLRSSSLGEHVVQRSLLGPLGACLAGLFLNLSLKSVKSSLGAYFCICCGQSLRVLSESRPLYPWLLPR